VGRESIRVFPKVARSATPRSTFPLFRFCPCGPCPPVIQHRLTRPPVANDQSRVPGTTTTVSCFLGKRNELIECWRQAVSQYVSHYRCQDQSRGTRYLYPERDFAPASNLFYL